MCVIVIKKNGVDFPSDELIKDMWSYNPDGAGFAYVLKNMVYVEKGFLSLKTLNLAIKNLKIHLEKAGTNLKDIPVLLHFRIGTHGGNTRENTHPFPITSNLEEIRATKYGTDLVVAHNGIIHCATEYQNISDTMSYIMDILAPIRAELPDFLERKHIATMIDNTVSGSKLAFLDSKGTFTLFGQFKESTEPNSKGLLFSNLNHEVSSLIWTSTGSSLRGYNPVKTIKDLGVVKARRLPEGTKLANYGSFDKNLTALRKGAKPHVISDKDLVHYYVDEIGVVYFHDGPSNTFWVSSYYDYAFIEKKDGIHFVALDDIDAPDEDIVAFEYVYGSSALANIDDDDYRYTR